MDVSRPLTRRHLLGGYGVVVALGALAGCVGGDSSGATSTGDMDETATGENGSDENPNNHTSGGNKDPDGQKNGNDDPTDNRNKDNGGASLNLREANVVGVEFRRQGGEYQFDVTLHHDDDGEEGYANWWQVERLDGTRLGRRDLLHAHSRQPFTRSESVEVPSETSCVVVRGHDQTHGYGGQAMLLHLDSGGRRTVEQGSEVQSFDADSCPETPTDPTG